MLLNLTTQKEEIKHKLKCFYASKIYNYLEFKRWGLNCSKEGLFKELLELRHTLFLVDAMSDTCELEKLNYKIETVMAKVPGTCFDDDCLKRTQIEALITGFLDDYYTKDETDTAIDAAIAAIPPPVITADVTVSTDLRELLSVTDNSIPPAYSHEVSLTNEAWTLLSDTDLVSGITTEGTGSRMKWRINGLNQLEITGTIATPVTGVQLYPAVFVTPLVATVPFDTQVKANFGNKGEGFARLFDSSGAQILLSLNVDYTSGADIWINFIASLDTL